MKKTTLSIPGMTIVFMVIIALAVPQARAYATSSLNSVNLTGTSYTQNFNTLANSGSPTWSDDSTLTGWYLTTDVNTTVSAYLVGTGSGTTGGFYSYGSSGSTDRALGGLGSNAYYGGSGTGKGHIGLVLLNNTGATITDVIINYYGEQWRANNTAAQSLQFTYKSTATAPVDSTTFASSSTGWTSVAALNFTSPILSTAGAIDGNNSTNRTALTSTISGLSIPQGSYLLLRWTDLNDSGNDHGLAIDDLSLSFTISDIAPSVSSISPANSTIDVLITSDIAINFNESVNVTGTWYNINCLISGAHSAVSTTGPATSFTLNPDTNFANGDTCVVTIYATQVSDLDSDDPPDNMLVNFTSTFYTISADPAPTVSSTVPSNGDTGVALGANVSVTFSENVTVDPSWFTLSCTSSGSHSGSVSGGPLTYTIDPTTDFVGSETCTLSVTASAIHDQDINDPPDGMASNFTTSFQTISACLLSYTHIHDIQGTGLTAAITGTVTTQGVVVADNEGASPTLRGFYLQAIPGTEDGDLMTSEGIFVYNGSSNNVNLGDIVRVTGTASDYQGQTQISATTKVICGTGTVTPTDISMPFPDANYLERFEGMLVRFPQTLYVTEHYQLGRFGEVLLSSSARLWQPTSLALPGAAAAALQASNDLNQILIDDELNNQNPDPIRFGRGGLPLSASNTLRGGDTLTGVVGILTYTWGGNSTSPNAYRIRPINVMGGGVPNFVASNVRPSSTTAPNPGGNIRVVGMNFLNYFNTFGLGNCSAGVGGAAVDCRGAEDATEFTRQSDKIINAIIAMNADVIGLTEIENDGYGASSAIQDMVDKLNAIAGAGVYAFIDPDAATGMVNSMGIDAIKNGIIYKTTTVAPVGTTGVLNTGAFGIYTLTAGTSLRNRPMIAQTFELLSNGGYLTVGVNHLKSKGSSCTDNVSPVASDPDLGDGQGNCNLTRTAAADQMVTWLASDPTGVADTDYLLVGDYNSYAMEDPIRAIESGGYTNLVSSLLGSYAYSYVFDGQWGYLDHALASASLTPQVAGVVDWHLNSDEPSVLDYNTNYKSVGQITSLYSTEPYRYSDHDPVLIGINLLSDPPEVVTDGVTAGAEVITSGEQLTMMVTSLGVQFTEDMNNAGGGTAGDDVTNPVNFILVKANYDGIQTSGCDTGVALTDQSILISNMVYDPATFKVTFSVNNGSNLVADKYRLIVCGTTSVVDVFGVPLAGDGVNAGTDYILDFMVTGYGTALLPSTGFAMGQISLLPERSAANTYSESSLTLTIPKLGKTLAIVGVPQLNGGWDTSWLGASAGWLEGSAYPTWSGNTVITAHVWTAANEPGPFYNLKSMSYGDRFTIKTGGNTFTYEVRENLLVSSKNYGNVFAHKTSDWVTLVTCEGFDSKSGTYPFRRIIRAVLVNVNDIP